VELATDGPITHEIVLRWMTLEMAAALAGPSRRPLQRG
jgi:hypothetical protein